MKRTVAFLLALALLLSGIAALAEEKPTITIGVTESAAISDWENNFMTQYIEEKLGVNLDFVVYPSSDLGTKLNLMAMDGGKDLPDVLFYGVADSMVSSWASMGVIVPLTQYYEDASVSPNIHEAWERTGVDYRSQVTSPDGEIYVIPSLNQSYGNEHPMKIFIYKPFLDALNLEVPTTLDELYNVLIRVVNDDPNGNGLKDEIGIGGTAINLSASSACSGWFATLMNAFVYAGDSNYLTVNDGVVGAAYATEAWKEGLKYIAKLYREGLIQDNILTQDQAAFKTVWNSEEPTVFMRVWMTFTGNFDTALLPRADEYIGIMPFIGPEGVQFVTYSPSTASNSMVITKNCKDPELAFRIGDLTSSEYLSITTRWGKEGQDWDYLANLENADLYQGMYESVGFDKYIVVYDDSTFWSSGTPQDRAYRQQGPYVRQYAIANGQAMSAETIEANKIALSEMQYALHSGGYAPDEVIAKLIYTDEESAIIGEIEAPLKDYVREYASYAIIGEVSIDDTWDDYLGELRAIGMDEYIAVVQQVYTRMYGTN